MKFVYSLFTLTLIATLLGCGSSEPLGVDAAAQVAPAEDHDHEGHDHEGHDHEGHDHDESEHPEPFAEAE